MKQRDVDLVKRAVMVYASRKGITDSDEVQDMEGEALLACVEAIQKHPEYGPGLLVQAAQWACGHATERFVRQPEKSDINEDEGIAHFNDGALQGQDYRPEWQSLGELQNELSPESIFYRHELADRLEEELDGLLPIEKEIVIELYGLFESDVFSQAEIARRLNVSQQYISNVHNRALRKLKARVDREEWLDA